MNVSSRILAFFLLAFSFSLDAQQLITGYSVENGLPAAGVTSVYRDNEGYLWCGTEKGLALFDGWEFHFPSVSSEKNAPALNTAIHGIVASSDGKTIWVGTDSVIFQIDRFSLKVLRSFDVVKSPGAIETPLLANDTAVWVACSGLGIYRVRTSDGKSTQLSDSGCRLGVHLALTNQNSVCIADSAGNLVFTSLTSSDSRTVQLPAQLSETEINSLVELPGAGKSILLLTTQGIWRCDYSAGTFQRFYLQDAELNDTISDFRTMALHPDGSWWFAITGNGIYRYDPQMHKLSSCMEQGAGSNSTNRLLAPSVLICDDYGVVWCGTSDQGLFRMLHGRYSASSASGVSTPVCFRSSLIRASYVRGESGASGLINESVVRDYGSGPIELNIWQTDFAFPDQVLFDYQLEGSGEQSKQEQGLRKVTYADLGSGFYSLICTATVPGCNKTAITKLLTIKIVPPFWMSGWFIGITSMAVVLIITLILFVVMRMNYQRKLRKLKMHQELDKVRQRISRDIHDEIGAGLTRIALSGDLMSLKVAADHANYEKLKSIAGTARELSQSMKEVVWSVNPHYDSLDHMAAYFRSYVSGVAETADVRFRYVADDNIPAEEVNPETRRNLLLILKETISNAVKYSGATELSLEMHWSSGKLRMVIADNGKGFDLNGPGGVNSNGLRNIRQRAEASGCIATIRSSAGNGTSVEISGPLMPKQE